MRLVVQCGPRAHSLFVLEPMLVSEVKQHIQRLEGVPVEQQTLLFAGNELADHLDLQSDLQLDQYSLAEEVVVYMQRRLAEPRQVFLCRQAQAHRLHPEMVEHSSTLANIQQLFDQRQLTSTQWDASAEDDSCSIVVKRQDGTTTQLRLTAQHTIAEAEEAWASTQGCGSTPEHMTFLQAADGCLVAVFGPSAEQVCNTHTTYSRSVLPQPKMEVQLSDVPTAVPLQQLVRELCVMP